MILCLVHWSADSMADSTVVYYRRRVSVTGEWVRAAERAPLSVWQWVWLQWHRSVIDKSPPSSVYVCDTPILPARTVRAHYAPCLHTRLSSKMVPGLATTSICVPAFYWTPHRDMFNQDWGCVTTSRICSRTQVLPCCCPTRTSWHSVVPLSFLLCFSAC